MAPHLHQAVVNVERDPCRGHRRQLRRLQLPLNQS